MPPTSDEHYYLSLYQLWVFVVDSCLVGIVVTDEGRCGWADEGEWVFRL